MPDDGRIDVLADAAAIAPLVPDWWRLWRQGSDTSPFQSPAWLMAWMETVAPQSFLATLSTDGRLVGLLPPHRVSDAGETALHLRRRHGKTGLQQIIAQAPIESPLVPAPEAPG